MFHLLAKRHKEHPMRILFVPLVASLLAVTAAAAPPPVAPMGPIVQGLRLGLELPQRDESRPCGGICGLTHGQRVVATLALQNTSAQPRRVAIELTCSGFEVTLAFDQAPGGQASKERAHTVDLAKARSCRANAPVYRTLAAGQTYKATIPFRVPALPAAIYVITARATVVSERAGSYRLTSASLRRPIHR
jgi:hypothetical protein